MSKRRARNVANIEKSRQPKTPPSIYRPKPKANTSTTYAWGCLLLLSHLSTSSDSSSETRPDCPLSTDSPRHIEAREICEDFQASRWTPDSLETNLSTWIYRQEAERRYHRQLDLAMLTDSRLKHKRRMYHRHILRLLEPGGNYLLLAGMNEADSQTGRTPPDRQNRLS